MAANSYFNVFVTNVDELLASGDSLDLGFGQIGIVNARTNTVVTAPNFPSVRGIQILQGTTDKKLPKGMLFGNETWRSPEIGNDSNIQYTITPGQKAQNRIVAIGYDGVDTTKTMAPKVGKDVKIVLTLTGQPIANMVAGSNHAPAVWNEEFFLNLPCPDECSDQCGDTVECNVVADEFIRQLNQRVLLGDVQLVDKGDGKGGLLRVTKLTACDTPSGYPTTSCVKYELVVADNGTQVDLGKVQAQYPDDKVTKLSRTGIYTTYELISCDGDVPATYVSNGVVIPNCSECPSGSTSIAEAYVYKITRNSLTDVTANTIAAAYATGYVTGSAVKLSVAGEVDQVFSLLSTSDALTPAAGTDTVEIVGTRQAICVLPETETEWTEGDTCSKAEKTYQLTLKNDVCGDPIPAATLTAYYGFDVTLVETNTDTCTSLYQMTILSDNIGCIDCGTSDGITPSYQFTTPKPYNNSVWTPVEQTVTGTGCVCGVKIEAAYVSQDRKECFFEQIDYQSDPLGVYVSSFGSDLRDYASLCDNSEDFPVTVLQEFKFRQGFGSYIADQYKLSRHYFNNPWFAKPVMRNAIGYELGVDLEGYYDQHTITWKKPFTGGSNVSGFGITQAEEYTFTVYFPQGSAAGDTFRNTLNAWILSTGGVPA